MITHLKGTVHALGFDHVVLDVQGVGYYIVCSAHTLSTLTLSESVLLITELVIREDAHLLYGFHSAEERELYRLLVSVQGVGSKVAMALLSRGSMADLVRALQDEDKDFLCQAEGVGPKLGARLITELKDRMKKLVFAAPSRALSRSLEEKDKQQRSSLPYVADAKIALTRLGYRAPEIDRALDYLLGQSLEIQSVEHLIRLGLNHLSRPL